MTKQRSVDTKGYAFLSLLRTGDMLNRYLETKLTARHKRYDIGPSSFGLMNALLSHNGQMTPTAISKWMFRSKHAITSLVRVAELRGIIRKEPNPLDRRSKYVWLTESGRRIANKVTPTVVETTHNALSCLTDEELQALNNVLRRLRKHLYQQLDKG